MRFSAFQVPTTTGPDDDHEVIEMTVRQSLAADRQGFHAIWLPEHHVTGYAPTGVDPVATAAYLAPQLTQAWIGFAVTIVPSWHPVRLVERLNLLDHLVKGKLMVGLGSGVSAIEHAALGFRTDDLVGGMTDENLEIAHRLWEKREEDPDISFETKYFRGDVIGRVVPGAYNRNGRPNMMRVGARPQAITTAARNGWPIFCFSGDGEVNMYRRLAQYRRELLEHGHDEETLAYCRRWTSQTILSVGIGDTEEEGRAHVVADLEGYQRHVRHLASADRRVYELGVTSRPPFLRDVTDPVFMRNNAIWGTADQVEEKLREFESAGLGNMILAFDYGSYDPSRRRAGAEMQARFAEEIMPRFVPGDPETEQLRNDLAGLIEGKEDLAEAISHPTQRTGA